jgi:predicted flap endonuclease-1-like 5' DNA nuclease
VTAELSCVDGWVDAAAVTPPIVGEERMKFAKLVDKAWEEKTAAEILAAPPSALEGLTEKHDEVLKGLGITTIADLGKWKYATRAAALLALADLDN